MEQDKIQLLKTKIQEGIDSRIVTNFDSQKHLKRLKAKIKKSMNKITFLMLLVFLVNCNSTKNTYLAEYAYTNPERIKQYEDEIKLIPKVKELREKNIDFIAYKSYSVGSIRMIRKDSNSCPNCNPNYPIYLIWNENNKEYIQIFDNCGNFFPLELNSEITNFAYKNFDIIKSEKIKLYQIDKNTVSMIDHSTFKEFLISKSNVETYHHFNVYNLSTESESPNLNAEYNNNLQIVSLNNLINEQIKSLDSLDLFKRDLSTCKINSNNENNDKN